VPGFVRGVYGANFADDRDISDTAVIEEILGTIGQHGARVIELAISAENKERLRRETEAAWDLGIFGAPTCVSEGAVLGATTGWTMRSTGTPRKEEDHAQVRVERDIPGAGKLTAPELQAISRSPAACCGRWGRRSSGSRAM